jgi:DNA-binding NtrC family response regulator
MEASVNRALSPANTVLLVDESIGARAPLADLLRTSGYQVFEAATSDEALDLLNSRLEIETLIAQEKVQGSMGGLALADWVRKTRPSMQVLVVSDNAQVARGELDNGIVFLTRPVPSPDLLAVLPPAASAR